MSDTTQPTSNNKTFYLAIAFSIVGLFLLLFVPSLIAMAIVRCREKRQERRDALARQLEEGEGEGEGEGGGEIDDIFFGPSYRRAEEPGEASGWRQPHDGTQELDSATQLVCQAEDSTQQYEGHVEIREPQLDDKGKAPMYPQEVQGSPVLEQLPDYRQVKLAGRFQEHLPEAFEQSQGEQEAADERQDTQEVAPVQQQRLNKKQK
ncbi:hypothetical protein TARUN_10496 [Trichoderma arundinaceum]|uniref:Uncharacterized protein n=1 Tax=Trichoderma arundinaceum TaxID=490622 RepID=A0A395N6L2_TRIAR|nr:hypothetical protein TARUN_10496 [Trichoderma arundinaceum]